MACDDPCSFGIDASEFKETLAHIAVGSSVESVATDGIFFIVFIGDRENIAFRRHRLMERCIKDSDHRNIRSEYFTAGSHGDCLRRVVKGTEFTQIIYGIDYFIGHQSALLIDLAAVEDSVSNGDDLADIVDYFSFAGSHLLHDFKESLLVCREIHLLFDLCTAGDAVRDKAAGTYTLAVSLADHLFVVHLDQLIFKAAGTGIYN